MRPLRLDHAGAVWHITSRGNERREVFRDAEDRRAFLETLARTVDLVRWRLHAYVLMTNHYHLLIETPEPTLSRGMHRLNGTYTQRYNRRHARVGHLFQGRFKSILVERERHLMTLIRYIVLNPVRAGLVDRASEWQWSSYCATAGTAPRPNWLETAWILAQFGSGRDARARYRTYVAEGEVSNAPSPLAGVVGQIFLGGDDFLLRAEQLAASAREQVEIPRTQRRPARPSIDLIARCCSKGERRLLRRCRSRSSHALRLAFAYLARTDGLLPNRVIADELRIARSQASRLAIQGDRLFRSDAGFRREIDQIRTRIWSVRGQPDPAGANGDLTPC
ncbi:MAG TPA: transposase [Thermoanaerobaculia bacterium]|nr:transposase [Thermoanaerobaculia bacterium]